MHAGLSNWRWFRTLVWLIGQVPTLDLDPNCPLLPFFWFSRISLSSSFGPHVDFSQRDLKVVHTQERQEHKHHFAWKKSWCLFIKRWRNWDSKTMQGFFWKGGSTKHSFWRAKISTFPNNCNEIFSFEVGHLRFHVWSSTQLGRAARPCRSTQSGARARRAIWSRPQAFDRALKIIVFDQFLSKGSNFFTLLFSLSLQNTHQLFFVIMLLYHADRHILTPRLLQSNRIPNTSLQGNSKCKKFLNDFQGFHENAPIESFEISPHLMWLFHNPNLIQRLAITGTCDVSPDISSGGSFCSSHWGRPHSNLENHWEFFFFNFDFPCWTVIGFSLHFPILLVFFLSFWK